MITMYYRPRLCNSEPKIMLHAQINTARPFCVFIHSIRYIVPADVKEQGSDRLQVVDTVLAMMSDSRRLYITASRSYNYGVIASVAAAGWHAVMTASAVNDEDNDDGDGWTVRLAAAAAAAAVIFSDLSLLAVRSTISYTWVECKSPVISGWAAGYREFGRSRYDSQMMGLIVLTKSAWMQSRPSTMNRTLLVLRFK